MRRLLPQGIFTQRSFVTAQVLRRAAPGTKMLLRPTREATLKMLYPLAPRAATPRQRVTGFAIHPDNSVPCFNRPLHGIDLGARPPPGCH